MRHPADYSEGVKLQFKWAKLIKELVNLAKAFSYDTCRPPTSDRTADAWIVRLSNGSAGCGWRKKTAKAESDDSAPIAVAEIEWAHLVSKASKDEVVPQEPVLSDLDLASTMEEEPEAEPLYVLPDGEAFGDVLWPPRALDGHQTTCLDRFIRFESLTKHVTQADPSAVEAALAPQDDPMTSFAQSGSPDVHGMTDIPLDTPKVTVEKNIVKLSQRLHNMFMGSLAGCFKDGMCTVDMAGCYVDRPVVIYDLFRSRCR